MIHITMKTRKRQCGPNITDVFTGAPGRSDEFRGIVVELERNGETRFYPMSSGQPIEGAEGEHYSTLQEAVDVLSAGVPHETEH